MTEIVTIVRLLAGFEFERLSVVFLSYSVLLVPESYIFDKLLGLCYTTVYLNAFLVEAEFFFGS